tara:strand:- start:776 stop:1690 length:915 start_codon:yes stop_codon:yes gene_type:complete
MSKPLVSIIINCFNSDRFLKNAIDSIYAQTYDNWEIIFWDNLSEDESAKIAKSYDNKLKYFKAEKNTGLGIARKFAIDLASGDYLAFLDCDDEWLPNKLENQVYALENNRNFDFSYGGVHYINENNQNILNYLPKAKSGFVLPFQLVKYEIGIQSVLIRRGIALDFNENLQFSPDYDLLMNIASKYNAYVVNDYLIKYRVVSGSLTYQKIDYWWSEMKQTLDSIFDNNPSLISKYPKQYHKAYAKVNYLKAKLFFYRKENINAIKALSEYKFLDLKFFALFILSLFGRNIWNLVQNKFNIHERG